MAESAMSITPALRAFHGFRASTAAVFIYSSPSAVASHLLPMAHAAQLMPSLEAAYYCFIWPALRRDENEI